MYISCVSLQALRGGGGGGGAAAAAAAAPPSGGLVVMTHAEYTEWPYLVWARDDVVSCTVVSSRARIARHRRLFSPTD